MIKIIYIDTLFDKYISDYVYTNIGKVKPEEIENQIVTLYVNFGNTKLKDLDGKTPNEYYKLFTGKELIQCLKEHLEKRVPVSDFLCEAITANLDNENLLLEAHSLGLGCCWCAIGPNEDRIVPTKEILNLPEHYLPVANIAIGWPAEEKEENHRYDENKVMWIK